MAENSSGDSGRSIAVRKMSLVSIIGNIALSALKFTAGIFGRSTAMISDAVHSLSDVLTTVIAWAGTKIAQKAPDADHPYGHERVESIASLILGLLLLLTGLGIGKSGLVTIISGNYRDLDVPRFLALAAAAASILTKELMYRYTKYHAKRINSEAFLADAWHHRSDALSSVGALIGIGGAMLGAKVLEPVANVFICALICKTAWDILSDALKQMMDTSCGKTFEQELTDYVARQEDVLHIDMVRSRMFGDRVYVDMEIGVDGTRSLADAHAVAERVHNSVERDFPDIKHIMIHVNPA